MISIGFNSDNQLERRVNELERQSRNLNNTLQAFFVQGRLRTDRTAPTSSTDIQSSDQLYDVVLKNNYEYVVIDNAGVLEWRRVALSTF